MPLALGLAAMATRFELVLDGGVAEPALRAAGEAALEEIAEVERSLSRYRTDALPARLERDSARTAEEGGARGLVVSRAEIALLELCRRACERTESAFDPALGDPPFTTFRIERRARRLAAPPGAARLDFGGVGKGLALDRAALALRAAGVERALLHGGTSSVVAIGSPPGAPGWRVSIRDPFDRARALATVVLRDVALSVSAPHGRLLEAGGRLAGHVLDPRDGSPVERARLAAVVWRHGAAAEVWSTALLVRAERSLRCGEPPTAASLRLPRSLGALVAWEEGGRRRTRIFGALAGLFAPAPSGRALAESSR
jgi:thiamine biosynthesis lipoprotein